jgi:hypothetical protein
MLKGPWPNQAEEDWWLSRTEATATKTRTNDRGGQRQGGQGGAQQKTEPGRARISSVVRRGCEARADLGWERAAGRRRSLEPLRSVSGMSMTSALGVSLTNYPLQAQCVDQADSAAGYWRRPE